MIHDADMGWIQDLKHIYERGDRVSPRGMLVFETIGHQSQVSMINPIIFNPTRKLGYKFMAAEAAWILSGSDSVEKIAPYSKAISRFSDDGVRFFGAYGPKIVDQMEYVVGTLAKDVDSRQAVINIWRESPPESKDIPCTLSLQFLIRRGALHCVASMRSSDLWLGHPYDIFNFSAVSFMVLLHLRRLGIELDLGDLRLTAGSKHLYLRDIEQVSKVLEDFETSGLNFRDRSPVFDKFKYSQGKPEEFVDHLWRAAESEGGAFSLMFGD